MLIKVTKLDIKAGKPLVGQSCPIALAIERELFYPYSLNCVGSKRLKLNRSSDLLVFDLSRSARRFIKQFDRGLSVKPFSFKLDLSKESSDEYIKVNKI